MVETNFKITEIGPIPEDWELKLLEEISEVIDPHPSHRAPKEDRFGIPFFGIGDLNERGDIIKNDFRRVSPEIYYEHIKRYSLNDNLIALGRVASIGKVIRLRSYNEIGVYTLSPTLGILKAREIALINYIQFILLSDFVHSYFIKIMSGSTRSSVGMIVLRKISLPLPPLAEQQSIANALCDADAWIESLEKLIAKKRLIKQGTMQELLTPKEDWEVKLLEELAEIIDPHPSHRAPAQVSEGIPFLGIGDLNENGHIIKQNYRIVSTSIFEEHNFRYNLDDGLLGLGRVASIGKVIKFRNDIGKFTISPTMGVLRPRIATRDFLFQMLKSEYVVQYFSKIMSGSTRSSVGMIVLRKIPIPIPTCNSEQIRIANILSDMDAEIDVLEQKLQKAQQIKQGMMQQLLTGKIRLIKHTAAQPKEEVTAS